MILARGDRGNPAPSLNVSLVHPGAAGRDDRAVFLQADAVPRSGLDGGDVRPAADVKLTFVVTSLAFYRSVGIQN